MWIKGIDCLIQTSEITHVVADRDQMWGTQFDEFALLAYYRGGGSSIIDLFEKEEQVVSAKHWFYLLLTGQIEKEVWEQGRTDVEARGKILEGKAAVERRALMFPKSSLDQDAYQGALSEAGIEFVEFYEAVLAPDCEKFWGLLRAFRKEQIEMGWPAANATKRLVEIFEEATGQEYLGELDTGG